MAQYQLQELLQNRSGSACISLECKEGMADTICSLLKEQHVKLSVIEMNTNLYQQMKVKEYLQFFAKLHKNQKLLEEAMCDMHLQDLSHVVIRKLTPSQMYRVMIAREHIYDQQVILIREPLRYLEEDDIRIVLDWIGKRENFAKCLFITSNSLKDICLMPGEHYYIDPQKHIEKIENIVNQEEIEQPYKLSSKSKDKILLFHPNEIDYIESLESKSFLNVRHASFPCNMTMDELEIKLKRFGFYRSHRSYLVNMQKVTEIVKWTRNSYSLKLKDLEEVRIPLSKGRVEEMKDVYEF